MKSPEKALSQRVVHSFSLALFCLQFHLFLFFRLLVDVHPELAQNLRQVRELQQEVSQGGRVGREERRLWESPWVGRMDGSTIGRWSCSRAGRRVLGDLVTNSCPKFCPDCSPLARTVDLDEGQILEGTRRGWRKSGNVMAGTQSVVGGMCL